MLSLHESPPMRGSSRRSVIHDQIDDVTDRRVDQLVYDLYGLTDKAMRLTPVDGIMLMVSTRRKNVG